MNGVSISPNGDMFALSTGQRHFPLPGAEIPDSDDDEAAPVASAVSQPRSVVSVWSARPDRAHGDGVSAKRQRVAATGTSE